VSPLIHNNMAKERSLDFNYLLCKIKQNNLKLENILNFIVKKNNIIWANITIPYKKDVFNWIWENWTLDCSAKVVWAVNTITKTSLKTKILHWYNTDVQWILIPLQKKLWNNFNCKNIQWIVLWAGWTSRAVIFSYLLFWIRDIVVYNRSKENPLEIIKHFQSKKIKDILKNKFGIKNYNIKYIHYDIELWSKISKFIKYNSIITNTLPFWFNKNLPQTPIDYIEINKISNKLILYFDCVYSKDCKNSQLSSFILTNHKKILCCNGRDMIINQANPWFKMWTKKIYT
jgi:shikimate 5-dehydrogenase